MVLECTKRAKCAQQSIALAMLLRIWEVLCSNLGLDIIIVKDLLAFSQFLQISVGIVTLNGPR
jgi:hypothetical protein